MNQDVVLKDIEELKSIFVFKNNLYKKTVLVTGGTGLIGSLIIKFLIELDDEIIIYGLARNLEKAKTIIPSKKVNWIIQDIKDELPDLNFDYIIHTACPTQSIYLGNNPVEVIQDSYLGSKNIFEYAKNNSSKVVYLSSVEVYGQNFNDNLISEDEYKYINILNSRSCYPESKKLIECMASSYAKEYGTEIMIARLTQTFGAGINIDDNRVFAQFAKSAINNQDIILHTKGESSKNYIYTTDAINAIFYILFNGKKGEAYNIANKNTYISIYDLANLIKNNFNKSINIKIELDDNKGYAPITKTNLDTSKIENLGWKSNVSLIEMFDRLIKYLK